MAKQTFTTGQVLTAAQMTSLQETAMTGGPASTKTVSYVLVAADAGTRVAMNAAGSTTITVNTGLFSAGDTVSIQNIGAGVCTVTAGTATVNTSGSLVLAQYQGGILYFTSASAAIFFQFATPASGDIEGVTAGTGISGGGTSGTVTITNSMATEITAKGDLIIGTGNATFDNLPVGADATVLTADSTVSPTGLKWAAPGGASYNYTDHTPTYTNVTAGNGTLHYARYVQIGKFVHYYGRFSLGSTSSVTGQIGIDLPVNAANNLFHFVGEALLGDAGTNDFTGIIMITGTDKIVLDAEKSNATYTFKEGTSSTVPFTWTNTDSFSWSIVYEAA